MSPRIATVALLIALLLGGAAWYVSRPPTVSKAKLVPLMDVPVGDVAVLRFQFGPSSVAVRKNPVTRDWILSSGGPSQAWVASDNAVRGFLRLLAEDRVEAIQANADAESGTSNGVSISTPTVSCAIAVYPSPMGGRALAVVVPSTSNQAPDPTATSRDGFPRVWLAPERVALFQPSSVAAWREKRLLPGNGGQAANLVVESGSAKTTVVKSGAGWVVNPETADPEHLGGMRADPRTVSRVLGLLESAEVVSFPVDPKMGGTGLDKPAAKIEITSTYNVSDLAREGEKLLKEAPRATPDVEPTLTLVRTVKIGGLADAEGRTLYAMVQAEFRQPSNQGNPAMVFLDWSGNAASQNSPLYGPTLCIVPRAALEGIAVAPEMYAMRVPLANASPADIERVRLTDATGAAAEITLTADGWKTSGDTPRVLSEAETARVREFLTFFTDSEADSIRPAAGFTPQEGDESVRVSLVPRGLKDGMDFTLIRRSPQGATPEVFVTAQGRSSTLVYRTPRASEVFDEVSKLGR